MIIVASNSDSIFHLLSFLKRHPDKFRILKTGYNNVVRLSVSADAPVADADLYFPQDRLMVNRLSDDFVAQHGALLDFYMQKMQLPKKGFLETWVTTAYLSQKDRYFIELSFE
ncbi:hypothetical protein [Liquorilactobacillus satsumensis]|uniref:Uncharacterized protein n=1 Tax=Liquorilactobacillus satsumensis DSM 16230 = JCM 12392 TaxID=1423801 RepID=A0A0R1UVZ0_9LACO|nr:hypothetical protein [Liquorilactobacillus satsumensis]KRL97391.1 hypothetical protein FD50_GL001368 [Liquorilactobacillus satsumensis DSM 16230 = JCM 12392]